MDDGSREGQPTAAPYASPHPPDPTDPNRRSGRRRRAPILVGCLVVAAVLVGGPLIATVLLGGAADVVTVSFGTGGSGCELTGEAGSFPVGTPIRDVVTFSPPLEAGSAVTITVMRDETEVVGKREVFEVEEETGCIFSTQSSLELGHYQIEYAVDSRSLEIRGEFDVTAE